MVCYQVVANARATTKFADQSRVTKLCVKQGSRKWCVSLEVNTDSWRGGVRGLGQLSVARLIEAKLQYNLLPLLTSIEKQNRAILGPSKASARTTRTNEAGTANNLVSTPAQASHHNRRQHLERHVQGKVSKPARYRSPAVELKFKISLRKGLNPTMDPPQAHRESQSSIQYSIHCVRCFGLSVAEYMRWCLNVGRLCWVYIIDFSGASVVDF